LASAQDKAHLDIFREALVHVDPAIRFAAMEALVLWGHPELARPLLFAATEKDYEPILGVYAAAGLARMDDKRGLQKLRGFLDHSNWLVKAMAGRYLGDQGTAKDYQLLVARIGREQNNDFVVAEFCIAALKLWGKHRS
jgi:HEAT repeat protein